ncbi:MAG: glycosyltransferase family 2 protein [Saprospiraceae bacterium]|nr:glycosyltransferase family 2 protein [Saprospiraceae bacterium]
MPPISAVIITFNEERNIGRCLESLAGVADEIVVLDSFSSDDTEQICRSFGVRFEQHAFDGHIEQKNRALGLASHPFVLSLDADEALSDLLRESILHVKNDLRFDAYIMNRRTNYCGQWIAHSGWYPDRKLRLFDKRLGHWGGTNPHDRVEMHAEASTARLDGDLLHYSYYTVEEHLERARKYAFIAARAMHQQGKRGAWWRMWLSPIFKFIRNYILKAGFLDGRAGWTICRIAALETHWKYRALANWKG